MSFESRLQSLVERIRASGGRMTPQRMAILKTLLASDHPTIDEIYGAVVRDFPMTSLVTVYRTLALLRESGEVLAVDTGGDALRYDGLRPHHHPHLICLRCGHTVDAPLTDVRTACELLAERQTDWQLSDEVHFYGTCPACQEQAKAQPAAAALPSEP